MTQTWLNDVALLNYHKQAEINIKDIANKSIKTTTVKQNTFEIF